MLLETGEIGRLLVFDLVERGRNALERVVQSGALAGQDKHTVVDGFARAAAFALAQMRDRAGGELIVREGAGAPLERRLAADQGFELLLELVLVEQLPAGDAVDL